MMIDAKLVDPELRSLTLVKDSSSQGAFYTARQTKSEDDNYEVDRASGLHGRPERPMKPSEIGISARLKRINGLLAWWRIPDVFEASQMEALTKRSQVLIVDLVKLFNEASSDQGQALVCGERAVHAFSKTSRHGNRRSRWWWPGLASHGSHAEPCGPTKI